MIRTPQRVDPVDLSRLIDLAYEAPFQSSGWQEFTSAAAETLQTRLAMFHHMNPADPAHSLHVAGGIDESVSQAFSPRWTEDGDDIYLRAMRDQPAGTIRLGDEIIPPKVAHQTEIHRQLAAPWKLEHFLFASLGSHDGATSVLSLGRHVDDEPFNGNDVGLLSRALLPHLCRSITVHRSITSIRDNNALLATMFDIAPCGIVAFDDRGQPLIINETAASMFSRNDGLALRNGKLHCADANIQGRLEAALLNAIAISQGQSVPPPAAVPIAREAKTQPYQVVFSPLNQRSGSLDLVKRAACIALIYGPRFNSNPDPSGTLMTTYGLSKAEARLVKTLLTGKTMREAAAALSISPNTAKTHLSRVFHKTGVHSQTALLHLIANQTRLWP